MPPPYDQGPSEGAGDRSGVADPERPRFETPEELFAEIERIAAASVDVELPLRPEQRLIEDLGLDSLGLLTLAMEVENRFRIRIDERDEALIRTVRDLVRTVWDKLRDP